jgi:anti-anti-sigma factor
MPLTVTQRVEDDIGILELSGALTLGPSLTELRNKARQMLEGNSLKGVIVHAGAVTQTDSSGLGELTVVYTLATKKGCALRLVNVKPELRKILQLTRLDGLLPSAADIASAKSEMRKTTAKMASSQG